MPLKITQDCINCAACVDVCPNEAISRGNSVFVIHSPKCTECVGFFKVEQCVAICPAECIVPNPRGAMTEEQLFERAKQLHAGSHKELMLKAEASHFRSKPAASDKPVGFWGRLFGKSAPEPAAPVPTENE